MRMHPPTPVLHGRVAKEDISLGNLLIPKGTQVSLDIYELHHNPVVWKNPETFDPLRFAPRGEVDQLNSQGKLAWLPFNHHSRQCIGKDFSLMALKVTLAMLGMNTRRKNDILRAYLDAKSHSLLIQCNAMTFHSLMILHTRMGLTQLDIQESAPQSWWSISQSDMRPIIERCWLSIKLYSFSAFWYNEWSSQMTILISFITHNSDVRVMNTFAWKLSLSHHAIKNALLWAYYSTNKQWHHTMVLWSIDIIGQASIKLGCVLRGGISWQMTGESGEWSRTSSKLIMESIIPNHPVMCICSLSLFWWIGSKHVKTAEEDGSEFLRQRVPRMGNTNLQFPLRTKPSFITVSVFARTCGIGKMCVYIRAGWIGK